jgi:hypothetical protein
VATQLGFALGDQILEIGYSDGCDDLLRSKICEITGSQLIDIDPTEVIDGVILWWRDGDGDLIDELMDAMTYLSQVGPIWVMTPKMGRENYVEISEIQDAAPIAGLAVTSSAAVSGDWSAHRLVARKASKR